MDINQLKFGFASYLQTIKGDDEINYDPTSEISIFQYAKEFKDYIQSKYSIDGNIVSMSISDILDLEIVNGKLVDPDKLAEEEQDINGEKPIEELENNGETQQSAPLPEDQDTPSADGDVLFDESSLTDILNSLMEDELFRGTIDSDQNGEFSNEELSNFFNAINVYDGDGSNVSLEDILSAAEDIANNKFSFNKTFYDEENNATIESSSNVSNSPTSAQSSSRGGNKSGGGASPSIAKVEKKSIDNMTKQELQNELSSAQSDLSEKQTTLNDIISGNDPELQNLQKNINSAYQTYQNKLKEVDEDMAKNVDDLKQKIDDKENDINKKDLEITNQESTVSNCENEYKNAVSTRENLEMTKAALESSLAFADDEQKAFIQAQIAQISAQIEQAKQAEQNAKQALDEAKERLDDLKEELDSLQNELDKLNNDMTKLEDQITQQYPQVQESLTNYNNAKDLYNTTKAQATTEAKAAVTKQLNYINEINTALNKKDNISQVREYYNNAMGQDIVDYAAQFVGCKESDGSADKFLASWTTSAETPWCAAFVQYIYENSGYVDSLPEWYTGIGNKWSCGNLYKAATAAGAEISVNEAQTGDMVLFDWDQNGGKDHVGIIVSIENGIVTTIEGNTSDQVAYRTYKIDNPKLSFFKMM